MKKTFCVGFLALLTIVAPFGCAVHVVVLWASRPSSAGDRKVSVHSGCTDLLLLRGETESSVLIQFHAFQVGFGM